MVPTGLAVIPLAAATAGFVVSHPRPNPDTLSVGHSSSKREIAGAGDAPGAGRTRRRHWTPRDARSSTGIVIALTDEEKMRVAQIDALIAERAEHDGPWPLVLGPVGRERSVFEAVVRVTRAAGWDAELTAEGMLVITLGGSLSGPAGA
jgi:hypothetical protein